MTERHATRIDRLAAYAAGVPWAIHRPRLLRIAALLSMRTTGEAWDESEIADAIAGRTERRHGGRLDRRSASSGSVASGITIGVISLVGVMQHRADLMMETSGGTSLQRFNASLSEAIANEDIAAIVLDIDSPGGEAAGVEESAALVAEAAAHKPIVAVANTMAASAAY